MKKYIFISLSVILLYGPLVMAAIDPYKVLPPPVINFYNKEISDDEIFYVGGSASLPDADVIIYIQNKDGSLISQNIKSDSTGRWFYSHAVFLSKGDYIIWTQLKSDDIVSPPSPQIKLTVAGTAIQIGSLRISVETFYVFLFVVSFLLVIILLIFIIYHFYHHRQKHSLFIKEIAKTEALTYRGFVDLRQDIMKALDSSKNSEDKNLEQQLLNDLAVVEGYLNKGWETLEKSAE